MLPFARLSDYSPVEPQSTWLQVTGPRPVVSCSLQLADYRRSRPSSAMGVTLSTFLLFGLGAVAKIERITTIYLTYEGTAPFRAPLV